MSDNNPFLESMPKGKRCGLKLSPEQWAARGNDFLASIGRYDVHWFVHDEQAVLGWKGNPNGVGRAPRLNAAR